MDKHTPSNHAAPPEGVPDLRNASVGAGDFDLDEPEGPTTPPRRKPPEKAKGAEHMEVVTPTPYEDQEPKRKPGFVRIAGFVLLGVAVVLLAVAIGLFADAYSKYSAQDQVNAELAEHAVVTDDASSAPVVDWEGLRAIDPNVCAWIQIPGTDINFPVYQAADNEYYLYTNAYGEYGVGGQIFLDCENTNPGMVDEQTVIFGHHLQNGAMFGILAEFDNQAVFDEHSTVWYITEQANYELEPLLCYRTVGTDTNVRIFNWPNIEEFHAYLDGLLARSQASRKDASTIIAGTQHVLTLSTCSYEEDNGRTILVCVPKGEASAARLAY